MSRRPARPRRHLLARPLWAVAAWACLGWGGPASGAGQRSADAPHRCTCATHCKGASCCCPSDAPEPPTEARPAIEPAPAPAPGPSPSPCVRSTPCGDPDVPATSTARPLTRSAILPGGLPAPVVATARIGAASGAPAPPPRITSRLDDPPEA